MVDDRASAAAPDPARVALWREASNVLAVRLDNLGDVLMTTPALAALGAGARRLTLLTSPSGAALAGHLPCVDEVLTYAAPWVKGAAHGGEADRRLLALLAEKRFDAAVIFTVCTQSALPAALLLRLAGIPLRLAYSRENPYALLSDCVRDHESVGPGMRHEVRRQLDLVASVGMACADPQLVFEVHAGDRASMRAKLAALGASPARPFIVVHPGSTAASRTYPAERFGIAAGELALRSGAQIVFAGGPGEREACAAALAATPVACLSTAGQLSLGELAALIAEAELLVCNNSGPAHLAAATGTPVVVLYALTNPQHTPWSVPARVLFREVACRDCLHSVCPHSHHACLLGVEVPEIVAAGLSLWREVRERRTRAAWGAPA